MARSGRCRSARILAAREHSAGVVGLLSRIACTAGSSGGGTSGRCRGLAGRRFSAGAAAWAGLALAAGLGRALGSDPPARRPPRPPPTSARSPNAAVHQPNATSLSLHGVSHVVAPGDCQAASSIARSAAGPAPGPSSRSSASPPPPARPPSTCVNALVQLRHRASRNSSSGKSASRTPRSIALRTSRPTSPWAVRCGMPRPIKYSISAVASRYPRSSRSAIAGRFNFAPATSGGRQLQRGPHRVEGVEQRRLVLLQVAVVGQRQPLDQHQQRLQIADHPGRLAADQLQHVRIDLLRHDRRAGAEGLRQLEEAELDRGPEDPLLGPGAQVLGDHRQREGELQHEIAVAGGVEAVGRHGLEPQPPGHVCAVDRQARSGQGGRAQAQHVGPAAAIGQPLPVALRTSRNRPANSAGPAPAAPAAYGYSRAGSRRGRRRSGRRRPAASSTSRWSIWSIASRTQSRRSVATWSLRLRAVWSLRPVSPIRSIRARSMCMWMSSSSDGEREAALLNFLADIAPRPAQSAGIRRR